jgi:4-diphosphocytidyl-2-C-methyl-D-erythritol kinase
MNQVTLQTPAKINLCLSVLGKRSDGYHEVEMVMQAIGLYDTVTVSRAPSGISVRCGAQGVPEGEANIAWRAARAMLDRTGRSTFSGLEVVIEKRIPVAAGLGGGSSDAAAVLAACNDLLGHGLDRQELAMIGTGLGMDVPFFFHGPTAQAKGRGEVLTLLTPPRPFWVLLANPGFETSTAWVYKNVNFGLTKKADCNNIASLPVGKIAEMLHNDLETVTAAAHPVIGEMERALLDAGALGARMSGSGPTVFGVFATEAACREAGRALEPRGWRLFPAETLTVPPYRELLRPSS